MLKYYFLIFFILYGNSYEYFTIPLQNQQICMTKACLKEAARIQLSLDVKVDPCEDFYQFACGGFINRAVIPENKTAVGYVHSMRKKLLKTLKALLEKPFKETDSESTKKIKKLYTSCVDKERIEEAGAYPLLTLLEELGGWPVLKGENWNETTFDWVSTLLQMNKVGLRKNPLFEIAVYRNFRDPNLNIAVGLSALNDLTSFESPYDEEFNDFKSEELFSLMIDTAVLLGASRPFADQDLAESLNFSLSLKALIEMDDHSPSEELTVSNLTKFGPGINWLDYFNNVFPMPISEDNKISVLAPFYIDEMLKLLQVTPNRVIANFLLWSVVENTASNLDSRFYKFQKTQHIKLTGPLEPDKADERWEHCIKITLNSLAIPTASLFVQESFDPQSKQMAQIIMAEDIRQEFQRIIEESTWMDETTKEKALEKLLAMSKYIAYPDELLNTTLIDKLFENVKIGDDYFLNMLALSKRSLYERYSLFYQPANDSNPEWHHHKHVKAAQVNAFYYARLNSIYVPAGILQGIMFDKNRPNYMNYGSVGSILGHELTHGFDSRGRYYNKNGEYASWWDEETDETFKKRETCLREQYTNLTLPNGMNVDSYQTLAENIADNAGLKEAYGAYKMWVRDNGPEPLLPNIHLNQKQLFWLANALLYCEKSTDASLKETIAHDPHSPFRLRVLGPMMNMPAFAEDFFCKPGSIMNPTERCVVW